MSKPPTHNDMMAIIHALIVYLDRHPLPNGTVSTAKVQDMIALALAYIGEQDVPELATAARTASFAVDADKIADIVKATPHEANIYRYFDEHYRASAGKYSRIAFEEADLTVTETANEISKLCQKDYYLD